MFKNRNNALWVSLALFFFFCGVTYAHDIPISEIKIVPDGSKVHLELKLNAFELRFISEIDQNDDGKISRDEFEAKREAIKQRLLGSLEIEIEGTIVEAQSAGIKWEGNSHHLVFRAHYRADNPTASLKLSSKLWRVTSQSHITWVTYHRPGDKQRAKLDVRSNSITFNPEDTGNFGRIAGALPGSGGLIVLCIVLIAGGAFYQLKKSFFSNSNISKSKNI